MSDRLRCCMHSSSLAVEPEVARRMLSQNTAFCVATYHATFSSLYWQEQVVSTCDLQLHLLDAGSSSRNSAEGVLHIPRGCRNRVCRGVFVWEQRRCQKAVFCLQMFASKRHCSSSHMVSDCSRSYGHQRYLYPPNSTENLECLMSHIDNNCLLLEFMLLFIETFCSSSHCVSVTFWCRGAIMQMLDGRAAAQWVATSCVLRNSIRLMYVPCHELHF